MNLGLLLNVSDIVSTVAGFVELFDSDDPQPPKAETRPTETPEAALNAQAADTRRRKRAAAGTTRRSSSIFSQSELGG